MMRKGLQCLVNIKWRRSEHAHASYPGLFFRPSGFSPYMGREERRVQGLAYEYPGNEEVQSSNGHGGGHWNVRVPMLCTFRSLNWR